MQPQIGKAHDLDESAKDFLLSSVKIDNALVLTIDDVNSYTKNPEENRYKEM